MGERVFYVAVDQQGRWVGVLVFCAAARHLRQREQWIGWDHEQRRRRLALVACAGPCGAQRGPKALAAFAKKLSQAQRRVLGIRPLANGWYPSPSQSTFFPGAASGGP